MRDLCSRWASPGPRLENPSLLEAERHRAITEVGARSTAWAAGPARSLRALASKKAVMRMMIPKGPVRFSMADVRIHSR